MAAVCFGARARASKGERAATLCLLVLLLAGCLPAATLTPTELPMPSQTPTPLPGPLLVGAYWYPWYGADGRHWREGYRGTPLLGEYSSADPAVIAQQLAWAAEHGIDFWAASWWGRDSFEDEVIRTALLPAAMPEGFGFAILYESAGLLELADGRIDLSDPANRRQLVADIGYLAETYFTQPGYLTIDGRPVVFLYLTRIFTGDVVGAFGAARAAVRELTGQELFIIGDEVYWHYPTRSRLALFDGVTAYNMHTSVEGIELGFAEKVAAHYAVWAQAAAGEGIAFVPDVLLGFDDTAVRPEARHPVIPRSVELFSAQLEAALPLASGAARIVMLSSWNEWHEDTSIEPSEESGLSYLEALRAALSGL